MATRPSAISPGAFEADDSSQQYRLYVTAGSPVSARAVVNARRFFEAHLPGRHRLWVLDIAEHITLAQEDQIIASPTLLRLIPLPQRRFIGDMSDTARLRTSLGFAALPAS
jgi:circadian clock protein KaiB